MTAPLPTHRAKRKYKDFFISDRAGPDVALCAAAGAWLGTCAALPFILLGLVMSAVVAWRAKVAEDKPGAPMGPTLCLALLISAATGLAI